MNNNFIVCWDCTGLECIIPVTNYEHELLLSILASKAKPLDINQTLNMLVLRARYNPQRFYEIYAISATEGIEEKDIKEMFGQDPQYAAELIRSKGQQIYSDRQSPSRVKIT